MLALSFPSLRRRLRPLILQRRRPALRKPCFERLEDRLTPSAATELLPLPSESLQVVLVSEGVAQAKQIAQAAAPGVVTRTFDSGTQGLLGVLHGLSAAHGGARIGHLGLVAHGREGQVALGAGESWNLETLAETLPAWHNLLTDNARLDLYACNVAAGSAGQQFVDALAAATGATVYASTNAVGSGEQGDYLWEYVAGAARPAEELLVAAELEAITDLVLPDRFDPNNNKAIVDAQQEGVSNSPNLGLLTGCETVSNLVMDDEADWFRFRTAGVGTTAHTVSIAYTEANGSLTLTLYKQDGTTSLGSTYHSLSLAGMASGTFYLKVAPYTSGGGNPHYTLQICPPAAKADDAFEDNDNKALVDARPEGQPASPNLGRITAAQVVPGLVMDDEADWFRFRTAGVGTTAHTVSIAYTDANGSLTMTLYKQDGTTSLGSTYHSLSLAGVASGTYYVKVMPYHTSWGGNTDYTLQVDAPPAKADDAFEDNDTKASVDIRPPRDVSSPNFGLLRGSRTVSGLVMDDEADWFRFRTASVGTTEHTVSIAYTEANGSLTLTLYQQDGTTSLGSTYHSLSLAGKPAGTYYVKVMPYHTSWGGNTNYTLQIVPPTKEPVFPLTLSVQPGEIDEAGRQSAATATVTRDGPTTAALEVTLTNNRPADVTLPATVSISAGASSVTFPIRAVNNSAADGNRVVAITATATAYEEATADLAIRDDERPVFQFAAAAYTVREADGVATVRVTRTEPGIGGVQVQYATSDGTARAGDDYVSTSGTLTFAAGEDSKEIEVRVVQDGLVKQNRTFVVTLSDPSGGDLGEQRSVMLTLVDKDLPQVSNSSIPRNSKEAGIVFAKTREAYTNLVLRAYDRFLKRRPDPAGLESWVQGMFQGLKEEQLEAHFLGSAEYIERSGGRGRGWIIAMYQDLLGRTPSDPEVEGWLKELNKGVKEYDIAYGFAASRERQGQRIRRNYVTYLEREPTVAEVNGWVEAFVTGVSNQDIVATFVSSPEYYGNRNKGNGNRAVWVVSAYQDVLVRSPARVEVDGWLSYLS